MNFETRAILTYSSFLFKLFCRASLVVAEREKELLDQANYPEESLFAKEGIPSGHFTRIVQDFIRKHARIFNRLVRFSGKETGPLRISTMNRLAAQCDEYVTGQKVSPCVSLSDLMRLLSGHCATERGISMMMTKLKSEMERIRTAPIAIGSGPLRMDDGTVSTGYWLNLVGQGCALKEEPPAECLFDHDMMPSGFVKEWCEKVMVDHPEIFEKVSRLNGQQYEGFRSQILICLAQYAEDYIAGRLVAPFIDAETLLTRLGIPIEKQNNTGFERIMRGFIEVLNAIEDKDFRIMRRHFKPAGFPQPTMFYWLIPKQRTLDFYTGIRLSTQQDSLDSTNMQRLEALENMGVSLKERFKHLKEKLKRL